ncbi:MAG: DUF3392 family protein [Chitinispirillaceae bacterium]
MNSVLDSFADYIRSHINEICFGVTAVTIMISGPRLTSFVKKLTLKFNWFIRYCCYILLCTVGVGFLSRVLFNGLKYWFSQQSNFLLLFSVPGVYLGLAWIAKQQREI